jgi:hypothetical protein
MASPLRAVEFGIVFPGWAIMATASPEDLSARI